MEHSIITDRYTKHRAEITRKFYQGEDPGEILRILGTGDSHLHGESVMQLETSGGRVLYYKPRDTKSSDLLGDLADLLFGERMVPEQITGEGYAFQKAVGETLPATDEEKAAYYQRLGRLTALFYALGSTDMHRHNILCTGSSPVVIDTETLLCAAADGVAGTGEFSVDYGEIFPEYKTSVGECMVLPRFYGFRQTSPLVRGDALRPEGYEAFYTDGFAEGYRRICESRPAVQALLRSYAAVPFRYLLRSTQYYAMKIWQYQTAKDDTAKAAVFAGLEKGLSAADVKRWAPVLAWERSCIREGDIPYFWLQAGGRALMGDVQEAALIPEYLQRSPIDYAGWRIRRMNEQDLAAQTSYIRAGLKHIDGWELQQAEPSSRSADTAITVSEAIAEVEETLHRLWEERIELAKGRCLWHAPLIRGKVGSLFGLGEGFSGVAVFVHACAGSPLITGEAAAIARKLAAATFEDLAAFGEYLLDTYPQPAEERMISRRFNGGFDPADGLAGLLWALRQSRDADPARTDRILEGFRAWQIGCDTESPDSAANGDVPEFLARLIRDSLTAPPDAPAATDCLEGGTAARAALETDLTQAGILLKDMVARKKARGCYRIFPARRHLYFLPAFLRGNTGIAYILLAYAHKRFRGGQS